MQHACAGLTLSLLTALSACGGGPAARVTPQVPEALKPPGGELMTLKAHAKGVQIYTCRAAKDDPAQFEWVLVAPEATLTDPSGRKVARHFGGPTWAADDGSQVVGEVVARADSAQPGAIPQLLLKAKSSSGTGRFGAVRFIQRLNTIGGAAHGACTARESGHESRVDYSADYLFYVGAAH